jgi:pimeloyl-ACP methyl ester carboxylesterase
MARIVLVHGAFNELWGPHELKHRWLPALRDGLWHHGVEVGDDDVAVAFYGDLFRRDPETAEDPGWATARAGVADMLTGLAPDGALEALGQAANEAVFDRTVDMVTTMMTNPDLRSQVRARLERVVGADCQVLVGHSLGSVVSYNALVDNPSWPVELLVTLGSPLGSPMVFGSLVPAADDGFGAWPGSVQRWVNVAAVGDRAAEVSRLAEKYGPKVEDHLVDNGHRAHDPEPYLNARATGAAIASALTAV